MCPHGSFDSVRGEIPVFAEQVREVRMLLASKHECSPTLSRKGRELLDALEAELQEARRVLAETSRGLEAAQERETDEGMKARGALEERNYWKREAQAAQERAERFSRRWLCDCHTWPDPDEAHAYIVALEEREKGLREALKILDTFAFAVGGGADVPDWLRAEAKAKRQEALAAQSKPSASEGTEELCREMAYGNWKLDHGRPGMAPCMKPKGHAGKHDADWEA